VLHTTSRLLRLGSYALAIAIVVGTAEILFAIPAISPAAAAPVLLLGVLLIARSLGTGPALVASICSTIAFSFYFLQPVGMMIEDLNDWVAFTTFSLTAIIVGELAARAERRQIEAEQGRREIEQLYDQLGAAFERASEAEAARRNEQLKSALLDALTHNLRTPLTAIKASVTALLSTDGAESGPSALSDDSRHELLRVIDEESDRLNRFIEALTVADRPEPSAPQSALAVNPEQVVRDAVARAETVSRRHILTVQLDPALRPLAIDRSAIVEVLYILLDNASKYASPGTHIRVRGAVVDDAHATLTVEDEGPGIPPEMREDVFKRFFKIPGRESIDPRRPSIGLGLPIAKRLVESQAGRIEIHTPVSGRGTSISVILPFARVEAETEPVEAPAAHRP
jgi:two-component system sensor histidine kinase KdpD